MKMNWISVYISCYCIVWWIGFVLHHIVYRLSPWIWIELYCIVWSCLVSLLSLPHSTFLIHSRSFTSYHIVSLSCLYHIFLVLNWNYSIFIWNGIIPYHSNLLLLLLLVESYHSSMSNINIKQIWNIHASFVIVSLNSFNWNIVFIVLINMSSLNHLVWVFKSQHQHQHQRAFGCMVWI